MMRDMLRQMLTYLNSKKWNKALVIKFNKILVKLPLNINDDSYPDGKKKVRKKLDRNYLFKNSF